MDDRFLQDELDKKLFHAMEECGEFITAASKMLRWGAYSVNPDLPKDEQEYNVQWVFREGKDAVKSLKRFLNMLDEAINEEIEEAFPLV